MKPKSFYTIARMKNRIGKKKRNNFPNFNLWCIWKMHKNFNYENIATLLDAKVIF